jgi:hypothetical protein
VGGLAGPLSCRYVRSRNQVSPLARWCTVMGVRPRTVRGFLALLAICAVLPLAGCGSAGLPRIDSLPSGLESLSCPAQGHCYGVDPTGHVWSMQAARWSATALFDGDQSLADISCGSAASCIVVADNGNAYELSSLGWSRPQRLTSDGYGLTVSCASPDQCVALGDLGGSFVFDGTTWTQSQRVGTVVGRRPISCTASGCAAFAQGALWTFRADRWSVASTIPAKYQIHDISCAGGEFCLAVGGIDNAPPPAGSGDVWVYDGAAWSSAEAAGDTSFLSVSCWAAGECVASDRRDGNVFAFSDGKWGAAHHLDDVAAVDVSCTGRGECVATDSLGGVA